MPRSRLGSNRNNCYSTSPLPSVFLIIPESKASVKKGRSLVAFLTQNRSALATQCPKSQPCRPGSSKSQCLLASNPPNRIGLFPLGPPKTQHFKSQRLQDGNTPKSQTLAFYKSQRFSALIRTEVTELSAPGLLHPSNHRLQRTTPSPSRANAIALTSPPPAPTNC